MLLQMSRTHGGMCSFCGSLAPKCRSDMIRLVWGKVLSISGAFSGETGNTWGRELCSRGPGLQVWRFWSTLEAPDRLSSFNFRQRWEIWVDVIINVWRQFDVARKTVYVFFFLGRTYNKCPFDFWLLWEMRDHVSWWVFGQVEVFQSEKRSWRWYFLGHRWRPKQGVKEPKQS